MIVRAPASSANLGPGFDALGLALDLPFDLAVDEEALPDGFLECEATHPAAVAFSRAGGDPAHQLRWRSPIPPGRGLGYSGAARVAGAFAAASDRDRAFEIAAELEGHGDNAAASTFGGFVVTASGRAVRVPLAVDLEVVVWWPASETSTNASRRALPAEVAFDDAVHGIGHAALLVAALATGDLDAVGSATSDRIHQDRRLDLSPDSRGALDAMRGAGAIGGWLSGSGPAVASFVTADRAERVANSLSTAGSGRVLAVDRRGVMVLPTA